MPFIRIDLLEGRTEEQKLALIRNLTETVVETINAPRENVRIVITEHAKKHWSVGGVTIEEREQLKQR